MFRAQQNAYDDAVAKATDENLTSENWEYILDVCDRVTSEDSGPKDAVAAIIKRLSHRNANVQLYTLELANALSQNVTKIHRELASRSFTDALLRLASDRNTHQQVKGKILERMAEWTEMFARDPDLGIMEQAYSKLKSQNPNLHAPSKPTKQQITSADRQKEEEELQMALALSIKDKQPNEQPSAGPSSQAQASSAAAPSQATASTPQPQPVTSGTTAATVSRVRALYDFQPSEPGELQFRKGDIIAVLESVYKDWWKGSLRGQTGIFPLNYVEKLADPTQDELQREAQMEAEVFGEIKNVEKLLTLLSTSNSDVNVRDNEEITELYHSTSAIRPNLIELIKKYSQKKDDFTQLNEKFIKARRDYESLLEASMSQHQYGRQPPPQQGYNYPPHNAPTPGPGRFYTPGPDNAPPDPAAHQPPMPPQNGPQPFVYASQPPPSQSQLPYPSTEGSNHIPPGTQPPPPTGAYPQHRPQSTYDNPQELSSYASPTDGQSQSQQYPPHQQNLQPQPSAPYSPSVYSPSDADHGQHFNQPPPNQFAGQPSYPPPSAPQSHAGYESTPPPSIAAPSGPPPATSSYPPAASGPPGGGYQPYKPQQQPGYAGGGAPSDPNDYYR